MGKGLFLMWLDIEKSAGKTMTQILSEINDACGTAYRHNWPSKMADSGFNLERVPSNVRRYMMRKVLPVALQERGVSLDADALEGLVKNLT